MAGNNFNIPTFDIDLLNWSNNVKAQNAARARERQQDWNRVYDTAAALGKQIRAEEEAEKARKEAAEQASIQRQFQAQEAEKARAFQAAQNAENRRAQQEYNAGLKAQEEAKQAKKDFDAAQILYGDLISKENPTLGDEMRINQLRAKYPTIDQYDTGEVIPTPLAGAGKPKMGSMWDDIQAKRDAEKNEALRFSQFKATVPTTFSKKNPKETWLERIDAAGFSPERTQELYNMVGGVKDLNAKVGEANQNAIAANAGQQTKTTLEQAQAEKAVNDKIISGQGRRLTKPERELAKAMHWKWNGTDWSK